MSWQNVYAVTYYYFDWYPDDFPLCDVEDDEDDDEDDTDDETDPVE